MEHVDPEVLALVALGEPTDDDTLTHLATCGACRAEVASLRRVVAVGRSGSGPETLVPAPDAVWAGIRSELGLPAGLEPDGTGPVAAYPHGRHAGSAPTAEGSSDVVRPISSARSRRAPWIAAAAAAGVVIGGTGGAWWAGRTPDATPTVLAAAALDPLPGWTASGDAVVQQEPDGSRQLVLTVSGDQAEGGYREVWLIDRDVTRLVSLGVLEGSTGTFVVPEGLDLDDFAVVDVSEEPLDGNPAHSGDSVVRGVLEL